MKLSVELAIVLWTVMWLFNQLSFISQRVKDIVNAVVIILLLVFAFGWGPR